MGLFLLTAAIFAVLLRFALEKSACVPKLLRRLVE